MHSDIYDQITGHIVVTSHCDSSDGSIVAVTFEWKGGDVIGISQELLNNFDERFAYRKGKRVCFGPFIVEILAEYPDPPSIGIVLARRIYDPFNFREPLWNFQSRVAILFNLICNELRIPQFLTWLEKKLGGK